MANLSTTETPAKFFVPRWVVRNAWKAHKAIYRWSGGRFGLRAPTDDTEGLALLTATGRRSGEPRAVMIAYFLDGTDMVTMAMNGWDVREPAWWLNLQAEPQAMLETADGTIAVTARAAVAGAEHDRLWERWRTLDKFVDKFSSRRTNGTAVVILSPTV